MPIFFHYIGDRPFTNVCAIFGGGFLYSVMRKPLLLCIICILSIRLQAQLPGIEEKTKGMTAYPGFFNFYWDARTGKIWLEINRLDSEVLYQPSLPAGLGSNDIGLDRGLLGPGSVVRFTRVGNKVLMIQP